MTMQKKTTTEPPTDTASEHGASVRDRLRNRQRPTSTLTICDDYQLKQALATAKFMHQRIKAQAEESPDEPGTAKALADAEAALAKAQATFDGAAIVLRFQALEREAFEELKDAHPPTEEQAEDGADWNIKTWGPALISAASLDGITLEDAAHYMLTWSNNEAVQLYDAAFAVQTQSRMDLGKG